MKLTSKKVNAQRDRETIHSENCSIKFNQNLNEKGEGLDFTMDVITEDRIYTLHVTAEEWQKKPWAKK